MEYLSLDNRRISIFTERILSIRSEKLKCQWLFGDQGPIIVCSLQISSLQGPTHVPAQNVKRTLVRHTELSIPDNWTLDALCWHSWSSHAWHFGPYSLKCLKWLSTTRWPHYELQLRNPIINIKISYPYEFTTLIDQIKKAVRKDQEQRKKPFEVVFNINMTL